MTTASSWHPPVCQGSIVRFCSTVCCTTTVRWQTRSPSERRLTLVVTVYALLLTKPSDIPRSSRKDQLIARMIERVFPASAHQLRTRAERYNACVARAKQYQQEGRLLIVEPCDTMGCRDTPKPRTRMPSSRRYQLGWQDGDQNPTVDEGCIKYKKPPTDKSAGGRCYAKEEN